MKTAIFFFILFTSFICGFSQNSGNDTLVESEFSKDQRRIWDSLETEWTQKQFNPFLKKNKIRVSCSGCERVMLDVYFVIDSSGKVQPTILKSKKCESDFNPKQKEQLLKSLSKIKFPENFYNTNVKISTGRALKC